MAHRLNHETETLLVVDDDAAIRKLEAPILSQLGHKVLEAEDPAEAIHGRADHLNRFEVWAQNSYHPPGGEHPSGNPP